MPFNIKNGIILLKHDLKDTYFISSLIIISLPAIALYDRFGWKPALIYELVILILIFLIRCWFDPVKLGYTK